MTADRRNTDAVIIGGGASGLAAAVELGMRSAGLGVLIIEKMPEPGRKLRASGSGRCNITNTEAAGFSRIMAFFREIGLVTKVYDNGLVYPYSESASDVVKLLTDRALYLGAEIACGEEALSVKSPGADDSSGRRFVIESLRKDRDGEHHILTYADYVILAAGGKAGPSYGTTGDGYRLARGSGHSIVTPVPALTGIECSEWDIGKDPCAIRLAGTRHTGVVSLYRSGLRRHDAGRDGECAGGLTPDFTERGEVQFTKYGLSGICIFNMTRHMRIDRGAGEKLSDFTVSLDLFPEGKIYEYTEDIKTGRFADTKIKDLLRTIFKEALADYVLARAAVTGSEVCTGKPDKYISSYPDRPVSSLSDAESDILNSLVHCLDFHPSGLRGWKDAQVTMGGVSLDEINEETSESLLEEGLFITGELADRDFRCGGFNLSNAWITGLAAADAIAESCNIGEKQSP